MSADVVTRPCGRCGYPGCKDTCKLPEPDTLRTEAWTCQACKHVCRNARHDHAPCRGSGAHSGFLGSCNPMPEATLESNEFWAPMNQSVVSHVVSAFGSLCARVLPPYYTRPEKLKKCRDCERELRRRAKQKPKETTP